DTGATWTQVFGMAQAGGLISPAFRTVLKVASAPGGALAVGVVGFFFDQNNRPFNQAIGLFWSGNSGATWKELASVVPGGVPMPPLNNGGQAPVNFAIAIDPKNTNLVYVSGDTTVVNPISVTAFRIDANTMAVSSITVGNTANGSTVHADSRAITFDAN